MNLKFKIAGAFAVVAFALTAVSANAAFTRDLTLGSTGADVIELQTWLEAKGFLTIPAGTSKGYFGALTQAALAKYQVSAGITPAAGYFGPITRAKVAMEGTPSTPSNPGTGSDNGLSGGEASLEAFDLSSGDDSEVSEGDSAEVAEIEFDVEDGDILIDRVDLAIVAASSTQEETDPWDAFDSLRLLVDGEEIAEADLSDEDNYLDEDEGTIRLSNIDHKVAEGETVTIVVEVTAQDTVDGADSEASWTINVLDDGIRATDAEDIQQYVGDEDDTVEFDIEEEGADDELNVSTSSDDPDAGTIEVKDDEKSDAEAIFAFDLEAEENDIEIDTVTVIATSSSALANVVADYILEIDGEEFDDWSYASGVAASTTREIAFDIDGDYTLDADTEVTVVLKAEFKAANGSNYSSGATITAGIADAGVEGEGSDDIDSEGSASGDTHTLSTAGVTASVSEKSSSVSGDNDTVGEFEFVVDVTAFEDDAFVELAATRGTTTANTGFNVIILDGNNDVVTTGTTTFSIEADEDETDNDRVEITDGDTVQFTVTVFFDSASSGSYKAQLYSVNHNETDADEDTQYLLVPASSYRTTAEYVNAS